jgi:hypothetical protein
MSHCSPILLLRRRARGHRCSVSDRNKCAVDRPKGTARDRRPHYGVRGASAAPAVGALLDPLVVLDTSTLSALRDTLITAALAPLSAE